MKHGIMRRSPLALAGTALLLALSGCGGQDIAMTNYGPSKAMQICVNSGGTLQARGKAGRVTCVHPYSDAGRRCTTGSDCQGRCLADRGPDGLPALGAQTPGHCQADDQLYGCYAEVEGGRAKAAICVD